MATMPNGMRETSPLSIGINSNTVNYNSTDNYKNNNANTNESFNFGKSSSLSVLFNFLNITVGIGILSLPYAMRSTGMIPTIVALLVFGIMCNYTLNLLVKSSERVSVYNYEALSEHCFGSFGFVITSLLIFVMVFGGLITELIAIGDASILICALFGFQSEVDRQVIMVAISVSVIFPFCLFRDLSSLSKMSFLKIVSVIFIIFVVFYYWIWNTRTVVESELQHPKLTEFNIQTLSQTFGIIAFSFLCHDCVFLMYNTLSNPSYSRWKSISFYGISLTIAMNLLFAIPSYLTFGNSVQSNAINNYPISNVIFVIVRIIIIMIMALSYPPAFLLVRHVVYCSFHKSHKSFRIYWNKRKQIIQPTMIRSESGGHITNINIAINTRQLPQLADIIMHQTVRNAPNKQHLLFSFIVFFSNLAIALFVNDLGMTMAIIGCVSSINLELVLPCAIWICISCQNDYPNIQFNKLSFCHKLLFILKTKEFYIPLSLMLFGCVFAVTGLLSIASII